MTKITILGGGITALAIAATLPKQDDVTIMARNLPGDAESQEWASPWAGAIWLGLADSSPAEQKMQLDALAFWWQLALRHPESSVRRVEMHDIMDHTPLAKVWYRDRAPGFRVMHQDELPPDAKLGVAYGSIVLSPGVFLPWMRGRLEAKGVKFLRTTVRALSDLRGRGHDVLINATGNGAKYLSDVRDENVVEVRGQTVLVKSSFDKAWIRRGNDYTYHLPRGDGTAVLGGIKDYGSTNGRVDESTKLDILRRIHENIPHAFPSSNVDDFEIINDLVGIRPQREGGVRLEAEVMDGQQVVHAYGVGGGGYVFSWGVAKEACRIVDEIRFKLPADAKL